MELEQSLRQLQHEGKLDSHGLFTLDLTAQARKLGHSSGAEPGLCLLKMVQAAVASGAAEVRLTTTKSSITAEFALQESLNLDSIVGEDAELTAGERYVRSALLVAVGISPGEVTLTCGAQSWSTSGKRASVFPGLCRITLSVVGESWWKQFLTSSQHAHLYRLVSERCAQCPIPVKMDRRSINRGRPEASKSSFMLSELGRKGLVHQEWLAERFWVTADSQCLHIVAPIGRTGRRLYLGDHAVVPLSEFLGCVSVYRILSGLGGRGYQRLPLPHVNALLPSRDGIDWGPITKLDSTKDMAVCIERTGRPDPLAEVIVVPDVSEFLLPSLSEKHPTFGSLPGLKLGRWLGLIAVNDEKNSLIYCSDGVLMNPIPFEDLGGGIRAIVAARVKTDLTGLEVIRDEAVEKDIDWAKVKGRALLERARVDVGLPKIADSLGMSHSLCETWGKALKRIYRGH